MKLKSNQIIIVLVAFMVGVAFASFTSRNDDMDDQMEHENMEESENIEENEGEEENTEAEPTGTTAAPAATNTKPSNEFVSGNCSTGLSGYKDNKLNAIVLNWSPCASDNFQFYKLVKSSKNTNPSFPADPVALLIF